MKIYQVLLLFILCCKTTAQENITVEYNQIFNTDFPTIGTGVLQIEKDNSIFVDMLKTYRDFKKVGDAEDSYLDFIKDNKTEIAQGEKIIISFGGNYDNYYFVNDLKNNTFHFTDELSKKLYLIKDDFKLNWKMTDETKIVSGKKTYKAETFFRGRKWIAWFCPDLPFPYGPWKMHGLPGLILETYDESNRYHFVALKIFESNDQLSFDCQKCIKTDIISFIKEKYKLNENYLFIPDRDLKVISYEIPYNRMELKYEWEE